MQTLIHQFNINSLIQNGINLNIIIINHLCIRDVTLIKDLRWKILQK